MGGGREAGGAGDGDEQDKAWGRPSLYADQHGQPSILTSINNLAFTWKSQGRYIDAVELIASCV